MFLLLFALGFFVSLKNSSLTWRRYHNRCKTANFDLCLALMAKYHWGFVSMSHLLWHMGHMFIWSSQRTHNAHTYCWGFDSGAVTSCFNDSNGLSSLGSGPPLLWVVKLTYTYFHKSFKVASLFIIILSQNPLMI